MAADDKDNEVDGDGATCDGATGDAMAVDDEDNEVDGDGVNDPRSRREGKHKKNTSLKKAPLSPQVHAADIPQDSRTHMDKKAKIS